MLQCKHIRADGTEELFELDENDDKLLEKLQKRVGGYIEVINLTLNDTYHQLIVNEEGLLLALAPNHNATSISHQGGWPSVIVGDAVLVYGQIP